MNKRFSVIAYFFLTALYASFSLGQTAKPQMLEADLRRHIEYLASDKLEGRRTGEPGANAASEYVAKQFRGRKLMSIGGSTGATFFQSFPYVTGVELAPTGNQFRLDINGNRSASAAKPAGFSPNGDVAGAAVVFAGFGIVANEQKYDDYAGLDAKGKVVLVLEGGPDGDNPHSPFGRFDTRTKALIARDKGAVGLLVVSREPELESDKLARLTFDQTLGEAALPTLVVSRSTAANILDIGEGELESVESEKQKVKIAPSRTTVSFKVNLVKKTSEARNVIGVLRGNDPVLKNEAIVIGAHYDHLGRGGQGSLDGNSTEVHHGADDNASGTAAVIELAHRFAAKRYNKRTIIFIAFSGEEEGLLGSQYYVNNPLFPLDKTVAMINLDMVGRLSDQKLTIGGVGTAAEWRKIIDDSRWARPQGDSAPFSFKFQLNDDGFGPSDHSSFYSKKIPVLFFFTGTHNDYHKASDTADKINYSGVVEILEYVQNIVNAVDSNPKRLNYAVAKTTMSGGRSGFNISLGTVPNYADATDGLLLDAVRDDSPAAKAGILAGDKIVKLAGKDIRNVMDYTYVLGEMKAGVEYEVVVHRGTEILTLKITPVKR
jgi:hypothetical protein